MYHLAAAAGDRWELPNELEAELAGKFARYIKATERCAGLWADTIELMMKVAAWNDRSNPYWCDVARELALDLEEESEIDVAGIAPEGHETLVTYYEKYAETCAELADSIVVFLDANGSETEILTALRVFRAHNEARGIYLASIGY